MSESPADALDTFLTDELPGDRQDIYEIEELLRDVTRVYETVFDQTKTAWPYQVQQAVPPASPPSLSHSTTAMILGALLRMDGRLFSPEERSAPAWLSTLADDESALNAALKQHMEVASDLLLREIVKTAKGTAAPVAPHPSKTSAAPTTSASSGTEQLELRSGSFGPNDVFTLAWVAEVSKASWSDSTRAAAWERVSQLCLETAKAKLTPSEELPPYTALLKPDTDASPVEHAFPALKLVHTIRRIGTNKHGALPKCYPYFERVLHQQLSYSAIPDSRFDPAELAFCLEGMLQCQRNTVDNALFERVIAVLTSAQSENAFWRPVKPFLATMQGFALFPVSVEVANSLLRSAAIFDHEKELQATYASKCIPLARRYWRWLRARTVRFRADGGDRDLVGWHSEHVNEPTKIHLWETSQVIEFLLAFRNLLHAHIARTTLLKSRFYTVREPKKAWDEDQEPVRSLGDRLRVFKRIKDEFIDPHLKEPNKAPRSMLLYGPPGTGKTRVAEGIARALNRRLITITVSDFLASGGAQVEARAKQIFQVLMDQPPCVVLFDEIDHFLLDRDSKRYREQETTFQFMTPGMLTKLNDLRNRGMVLFVVATNYEERIDPAIKRPGRIDQRYLLLPADGHLRRSMLTRLASKAAGSGVGVTVFGRVMDEALWQRLIAVSLFLGWNEIKTAVSTVENDGKDFEAFEALLKGYPRIISLGTYESRLSPDGQDSETPALAEFLCLVALSLESPGAFTDGEKAALLAAKELLGVDGEDLDADVILEHAPDLNPSGALSVANALRNVAE